ncbi:hypothetical protein O0S10_08885 [Methanocorpusculum sp. MG]|uniref:DUF4352 domain-containing protein n=1 Tax=Methanocorpusculum petauri TaxID=3002863 RepID=A0ABT4IHW1_9EURY|nr:hypothetical protein [Methanocorpusculum petauri]MCZ0861332.1 hypothetical protein [Methanocorpusculum petauri]
MKYAHLFAVVLLLGCLVLAAGCVNQDGGGDTPAPTVTPTETPAPVESVKILPDTPGVTYTLTAKKSTEEAGNVELTMKAVAARDLRKDGYNIRYTFFVYNTDAFAEGWSPSSYDEVVTAGVPYVTKIDRIYPANERVINVMLPRDASVKTFDVTKPYVYGVVAVDVTV